MADILNYQNAEKEIKEQFWLNTHDKACKFNVSDAVKEKLYADDADKDPEYYNNRAGVVHASTLSGCLRGVVLAMMGAKKDAVDEDAEARKLGVFKAGNLFEEFIVNSMGNKMESRQTEYIMKYKGIILTGRDDGIFRDDQENRRLLEAKSVHSDSFWYREKEGTLVAWQNQIQIQIYLWLRRELPSMYILQKKNLTDQREIVYTNLSFGELREYKKEYEIFTVCEKPDESNLNGYFSYVSKDDCTVIGTPIKYNPFFTEKIIIPILDGISEAYDKKDLSLVKVPDSVIFDENKQTYTVNWLCKYCNYHEQCTYKGWLAEAQNEVKKKNKQMVDSLKASNHM